MPGLNEATAGQIPAKFSSVWSGIWDDKAWAAIVLVIALVAIIWVCFIAPTKDALSRVNGLALAVLGLIVLAIGIVAMMSAGDDAQSLADAFAAMHAQEALPEAFSVNLGIGWTLLVVGGAVAAIGGVLSLIARPEKAA